MYFVLKVILKKTNKNLPFLILKTLQTARSASHKKKTAERLQNKKIYKLKNFFQRF